MPSQLQTLEMTNLVKQHIHRNIFFPITTQRSLNIAGARCSEKQALQIVCDPVLIVTMALLVCWRCVMNEIL